MKKKIALLLTLVMCFSMVLCGDVFAADSSDSWTRVFKIVSGSVDGQYIGYWHDFDNDGTLTITKDDNDIYELLIEYEHDGREYVYSEIDDPNDGYIITELNIMQGYTTTIDMFEWVGAYSHTVHNPNNYTQWKYFYTIQELITYIDDYLYNDSSYSRFIFDIGASSYVLDIGGDIGYIAIAALEEITPVTPTVNPIENGNYTGTGNAYVLTPFGRFNIATLPLTKATVANNSINLSFRANTLQYNVIADRVSYDPATGANTYSVTVNDTTVNNGAWEFTVMPDGTVTGVLTSPNGDTLNFTMTLTKS